MPKPYPSPSRRSSGLEEQERLNGSWVQTHFNENGVEQTDNDPGQNPVSEFKNGAFHVRAANGNIVLKGTYRILPNANPPAIDWTDTMGEDKGKTFLAIYQLTQSSFVFSASDEGMQRPVSFKPQSGHTIRKFFRIGKNA